MTQKEILEYNKRCVEFLGFKYKNQAKYWIIYPLHDNSFFGKIGYLPINNLKFHSDWNWIHEVIEKMESLGFQTRILDSGMCIEGKLVIERWGNTTKEGVCKTINQFLIWYNDNK